MMSQPTTDEASRVAQPLVNRQSSAATLAFPVASPELQSFGFKFSNGGAHISRTMMLYELEAVLAVVPIGASPDDYRVAVLDRNVLGKTTDSTRKKTLRHMRELYVLDEALPIFGLLRKLEPLDHGVSLPLLALQVAWSRDPLFRATTRAVLESAVGDGVDNTSLTCEVEAVFPNRYSAATLERTARNAASSWAQAGLLNGRVKKVRQKVNPTAVAVTMALFLGQVAGHHGTEVFSSPWVQLLDLGADRARNMAMEANRAGLLNLRAVGDVVDLSFPMLDTFRRTLS